MVRRPSGLPACYAIERASSDSGRGARFARAPVVPARSPSPCGGAVRFLTVLGARPQFIKAAPLTAVLRRHHEEILVHTGQHYDYGMSEVFFAELGIPAPDHYLGVGSGSHGAQTGAMLTRLEGVMLEAQPDIVLVYGDTNSTLAGALTAAKLQIQVAHVEAGLRSFNRQVAEEGHRVMTDHVSSALC